MQLNQHVLYGSIWTEISIELHPLSSLSLKQVLLRYSCFFWKERTKEATNDHYWIKDFCCFFFFVELPQKTKENSVAFLENFVRFTRYFFILCRQFRVFIVKLFRVHFHSSAVCAFFRARARTEGWKSSGRRKLSDLKTIFVDICC